MSRITGFPPVARAGARVLILGSMPSVTSLEKQQYYGLPRNAFWQIMGDLFGAGRELPYAERLEKISECGIALWDVLRSCHRPGSLDSAIDISSARTNDFPALLREHASISQVFFNGRKACEIFTRRVLPTLQSEFATLSYTALPSTSPAHASMSYDQKLEQWSVVAQVLGRSVSSSGRPDVSPPPLDAQG
jgi:TDG/mug DNA glycosylase family protein